MNLKRDEETRVYTNITPKMAKEFMEHNAEFNRKPSMAKVYEYADLMKNGKWNEEISIIQDPIVFSKDGTLINGQHRCMAIIKADVDINSMVVYGAPSELYQFFDGVK